MTQRPPFTRKSWRSPSLLKATSVTFTADAFLSSRRPVMLPAEGAGGRAARCGRTVIVIDGRGSLLHRPDRGDTIEIRLPMQGEAQASDQTARDALSGPHEPARSLYLHVPFCFHKCHYCDFYSFVDTRDRQEAFVDALALELHALAPHAAAPLETIFVGGGTPSLLRPELWERLTRHIGETFDLSHIRAGRGEWTVECNPETVTPELMRVLRDGGVNRVSVGAQSFDHRHLKALERWHDPENVPRALALAADAGIERRSLDLIYAIPGQTLGDWKRDVETALAIDPPIEHISCYALTYEPNTAMTARLRRGEFQAAPDELEVEMYEWLVERLRVAGLERYEVSNFARRGAECAHNLAYWRQRSWLAAGPSASGHVRTAGERANAFAPPGNRWKNVPQLTAWMDGVKRSEGWSPVVEHETPDDRRAIIERVMTGLRLREGLDEASLLEAAATIGDASELRATIARARASGLLYDDIDGHLTLTDRGYLFADGVAADLMSTIPS
ncbi:MAG: radical SAM family heme chaperone HemW [Phycisphaerales bacterium]|nr:MAG: radical SAM family heme chaperone HemW [Phycisphaerales bacterium]